MRDSTNGVFRRISLMVFCFISLLSVLFIAITWWSMHHFYQATTQLLNKEVAAHIAKFTSPYHSGGFSKEKADAVFYNAMVLNPSTEVYFLDTTGQVIAYHEANVPVKEWHIPLAQVQQFIRSNGNAYVTGPDPRDPGTAKIFSAAVVQQDGHKQGYIYVILGNSQYRTVTHLLLGSHVFRLVMLAFLAILLLSLLLTGWYVRRARRRFVQFTKVLQRFEQGDLDARFDDIPQQELAPVIRVFNQLADLLVYNIQRLSRSEQERKNLIANISHDLRTPLSVARGYAETLLLTQVQPDPVHKTSDQYLQNIVRKITQVEVMVTELFELAKLEAVDGAPQKEPFVFSEILEEAVYAYRPEIAEKGIALDCSECQESAWILADVRMMERVIENLLTNAIKYTPAGGQLKISLQREDGWLCLEMKNDGILLLPGIVQWLNNNSDDPTVARRPEGVGLGLLIVKKILYYHEFEFGVNVSPVSGNFFRIMMPVYMAKV